MSHVCVLVMFAAPVLDFVLVRNVDRDLMVDPQHFQRLGALGEEAVENLAGATLLLIK
jgi:hypothetical protein